MKFLKASIVVVLLSVAVLLFIGVFVPVVDDEFEVTIHRPVMQVYATMANMQQAPQWVVGLDSVKQTNGFLALPGSVFTLYYSGNDINNTYQMEIVKMVPLQSVKFKLHNSILEFDVSIKFTSEGNGTKLNTYIQMRGKGLLARSFLPLLKSSISQVAKDNFQELKKLQEQ